MIDMFYSYIMNLPDASDSRPESSDFPTPSEEVDLFAEMETGDSDEPITAELPPPREQFNKGLASFMEEITTACLKQEYANALALIDEALAAHARAETVLPTDEFAALPKASSFHTLRAAVTVFQQILAVRSAAVLNLAEGWPLWSEAGRLGLDLEQAMADFAQESSASANRWLPVLGRIRETFYNELRTRQPATYGHPLLDIGLRR